MFSDLTLGTFIFQASLPCHTKEIWEGAFLLYTFYFFSQIYNTLSITISRDMPHIYFL